MPDDLAFVHVDAGIDDHASALLQVEQGVGQGLAGAVGDQHAVVAPRDVTGMPGAVVVEHVEHQAGAGGQGAEFRLEADQAAGRDEVVQPHAALAVQLHVLQLAAAFAEPLHDRPLVVRLQVHHQLFVGFLASPSSVSCRITSGREMASS